ncbi:MAG: DUF4492 domain-containing protein [Bacteroides sp.]
MRQTMTRIWNFYVEGFRSMKTGRTLWLIILIKLFVIFFILKLFFFPRFLDNPDVGADKGDFVSRELIERGR